MIVLDRPIPVFDEASTAEDYHNVPIDAHDPRYREPLVDAREYGLAGENYYARTDGGNPPYRAAIRGSIHDLWCRQTIATMLATVNERLSVHGVELFLWDAYRPIACQQELWEFFEAQALRQSPDDDAVVGERVRPYVSDPRQFDPHNPQTWPVHATGAAVDLTLRDRKSRELIDMGSGFDEMHPKSNTAYFERLLIQGRIAADDVRLRNRRLLYWAMRSEGFTNYSYEFWHFDYGDQMHVMALRQLGEDAPNAWYGYVPPPSRRAS